MLLLLLLLPTCFVEVRRFLVSDVVRPPFGRALGRPLGRHLLVIRPVAAQPPGLQLLDPGRHNGAQRLHGQFLQAAAKELAQLVEVANVEGVNLIRRTSVLVPLALVIIFVVV